MKTEAKLELADGNIKDMKAKLSKMEETEVILDWTKVKIAECKMALEDLVKQKNESLEDRISQLIKDELTHEDDLFGKDEFLEGEEAEEAKATEEAKEPAAEGEGATAAQQEGEGEA